MKCLSVEQIYLYIEKELSPSENKKIDEHLATCPKCKKALDERRSLVQASENLPLWKTPPYFTQQVMARIFPIRVPLYAWLTAAYAGLGSITLAIFILFLATSQNFSSLLTTLNRNLLNLVRNLSPFSVKLFKVLSLFVKALQQFFGYIIKAFASFTTIISPQVQIIIITIAIILIVFSVYGIKRKILIGEKA
jgi:predicted anti-sigma-YlaC factor YlaD